MRLCNTVQPSYIFILGHIIAFRMPHDAGKRCGIVNMLMKMCGARGALCSLATLLKTAPFHAEFEVFRGVASEGCAGFAPRLWNRSIRGRSRTDGYEGAFRT